MIPNLPKPFFVLAPMDEVTETVFRQIVQAHAPADLYFTEFVNVDGLQSPGRKNLMKKLRFDANEGPLVAQIWGLKPENFEKTAREIADGTIAREICILNDVTGSLHGDVSHGGGEARNESYKKYDEVSTGTDNKAVHPKAAGMSGSAGQQGKPVHTCPNFVGIDINMGCPAKSEVQNGACSALIKNRPLAKEIIEATQRGAGNMPVSIKTRLGFNEIDFTWHEFLLGFKPAMLTVHLRTRKEMSKVPAHWELAAEVVKLRDKISPDTKIVGNGDVANRAHGLELAAQSGVDGIMIGRGIFHDPFCFAEASAWGSYTKEQKVSLLATHVELFEKTWTGRERRFESLRKFAKAYINDFEGAKEMREVIMATESAEELLKVL